MRPNKDWRVYFVFNGVGCGFVVNGKRNMVAKYML